MLMRRMVLLLLLLLHLLLLVMLTAEIGVETLRHEVAACRVYAHVLLLLLRLHVA